MGSPMNKSPDRDTCSSLPPPAANEPRRARSRVHQALTLLVVGTTLWSCATTDAWLGDAPVSPQLTPESDASSDVDGGADGAATLMCVATECPEPYTTCPSEYGPTNKCAVDPRRDSKHCGGCGNECLTFAPIHMTSRCVDGKCELECYSMPRYVFPDSEAPTKYENCNGLLDDGCEVDLFTNSANCGACGNACAAGQRCIQGRCGCPPGLIECNGFCIDASSDDFNCGACGNECTEPDDPCDPLPDNAGYGCRASTCGRLKCDFGFADCDGDRGLGCASNGCETSIRDPNNCGACRRVCNPGDECREENGVIDCRPTCEAMGRVTCPDGSCADIQNDPDQCGGCGLLCPFAGPNQQRACNKGVCALDCASGFADCNGDFSDGCEIDLRVHPANCGACGVTCDLGLGQPCVEGKCLVAPCEGTETK